MNFFKTLRLISLTLALALFNQCPHKLLGFYLFKELFKNSNPSFYVYPCQCLF